MESFTSGAATNDHFFKEISKLIETFVKESSENKSHMIELMS